MNQRKGLRDLLAGRNKGSTSKEVPKSQTPPNLPPLPTTDLSLLLIPNLKKKRKDQELEKGEVVPQKGAKQQKMAKSPRIPKTKGPPSWIAGRSLVGLRCDFSNTPGLLGWKWMTLPSPGTLPSGSFKEGILPTMLRPWSSPFSCLRTWML